MGGRSLGLTACGLRPAQMVLITLNHWLELGLGGNGTGLGLKLGIICMYCSTIVLKSPDPKNNHENATVFK